MDKLIGRHKNACLLCLTGLPSDFPGGKTLHRSRQFNTFFAFLFIYYGDINIRSTARQYEINRIHAE
ncbi:MAG: hypothetical protein P4L92_04965, partial [Rudaea sp.]|nr:hypothetical protein [Rudaea sp.]